MKAHFYFGRGQWWCRRMGVIGCGPTLYDAWIDMWTLYWGAITAIRAQHAAVQRVREG